MTPIEFSATAVDVMVAAQARGVTMNRDELYRIAAAELEAVERFAGPRNAVESFLNHWPLPAVLSMGRMVDLSAWTESPAVCAIVERRSADGEAVLLSPAEFRWLDAWRVQRLGAAVWAREVTITYRATIDENLRMKVATDLAILSAAFAGYRSEQLGDWRGDLGDHAARREALLAQISEGKAVLL